MRSILRIVLSSVLAIQQSIACAQKEQSKFCNFLVSAEPIAHFALVHRTGETEHSCLRFLVAFNWPLGIYCPTVKFCGMGFDLTLDYRTLWPHDNFLPAQHSCFLIVNSSQNDCDEVRDMFHMAGLFTGKFAFSFLVCAEKLCFFEWNLVRIFIGNRIVAFCSR